MAKEIILIGVGPDGRDSLSPKTVELLRGCQLLVGGKRVISQFEDFNLPTYSMTANLRQLIDVVEGAEADVLSGRAVVVEARGGSAGDDDDDGYEDGGGSDDGDEGDDDGDDDGTETAAEGQAGEGQSGEPRREGRRRGRRRPSPRNRGRGRRGQGGGEGGGEGGGDSGGEGGGQSAGGGEGASGRSVVDAPADTREMAFQIGDDDLEHGGELPLDAEQTGESGAAAGVDAATVVADVQPEVQAEARPETSLPEAADVASPAESAADRADQPVADSKPAPKSPVTHPDAVCRVAILASGDPNFYGLSKFLLERFKKEEVTIIPHVSAMQLAFSAIKEPMNDAAITSSSGRNVDRLIRVVRQNGKVGIFTDKRRSPRAVARLLLKHNIEAQCYVCQDLGTPRERIVMGSLEEIGKKNFSPLSVMILFKSITEDVEPRGEGPKKGRDQRTEREPQRDQRSDRDQQREQLRAGLRDLPPSSQIPKYELVTSLGIPDEMLVVRPENAMRSEMRVIVLSKLQLKEKHRMWDVGAGCGALSVEASRVASAGEVFAVERDFAQVRNIYENIKGFAATNVTVIEGDIEEMAARLPEPDRIFIGGCGGHMKVILESCLKRLKRGGILVLNAATLESLTEVQQVLKEQRLRHDMVIVNLARTVERAGLAYFEGFNPGYLITTVKD
ncbi:MAG: precorrin-6y C5,15-methyltransferase (decarboxylating) subunit CbiE [Nitrospirota bacterium]|nr:precorrin-6y C5,15-methyltransferase (decarboxylating) subunit CbiE [Nitrospirota bacterium]